MLKKNTFQETNKTKLLLDILNDKTINFSTRDDAAMDLEDHHNLEAFNGLVTFCKKAEFSDNGLLFTAAGDSLGELINERVKAPKHDPFHLQFDPTLLTFFNKYVLWELFPTLDEPLQEIFRQYVNHIVTTKEMWWWEDSKKWLLRLVDKSNVI